MTESDSEKQVPDTEKQSHDDSKCSGSPAQKTIITILLLAIIVAGAYLTFARIQWRNEADLTNQAALRDQIAEEHKQLFEEMAGEAEETRRDAREEPAANTDAGARQTRR